MHYMRMRTTGSLETTRYPRTGPCRIDGCDVKVRLKGYCYPHYLNWYHRGDPLKAGPGQGKVEGRVATGSLNYQGYRMMSVVRPDGVRRQIGQHRLVMEQIIGRPLMPHENVHHINGVRDDNRPENLELWSKSQPPGQRVEDKLAWAYEFIETYADIVPRLNHKEMV